MLDVNLVYTLQSSGTLRVSLLLFVTAPAGRLILLAMHSCHKAEH